MHFFVLELYQLFINKEVMLQHCSWLFTVQVLKKILFYIPAVGVWLNKSTNIDRN